MNCPICNMSICFICIYSFWSIEYKKQKISNFEYGIFRIVKKDKFSKPNIYIWHKYEMLNEYINKEIIHSNEEVSQLISDIL